MFHLVVLLLAALVTLQCSLVTAEIGKIRLDNSLAPNVASPPKRKLKNFVVMMNPPPEVVRHAPGTRAEVECAALGHPAPTIQWLRNGEPVDNYEQETNEIFSSDPTSVAEMNNKLLITSSSPGDVYTCVATSGLKQTSASTRVYTVEDTDELEESLLLQKLFRIPSQPIITAYYREIFQNRETDLLLPCRVSSADKVEVFWQYNQDNSIFENSRVRVLPSGDLLITGLRWSDMGNYTCNVQNRSGKDSATTFVYPWKP